MIVSPAHCGITILKKDGMRILRSQTVIHKYDLAANLFGISHGVFVMITCRRKNKSAAAKINEARDIFAYGPGRHQKVLYPLAIEAFDLVAGYVKFLISPYV